MTRAPGPLPHRNELQLTHSKAQSGRGETNMSKWAILVALTVLAAMLGRFAFAQKDGVMKRPDPADLATEDVKEIVLLMDTDKQGKITKEAWMKFMAAEFDRLDTDKRGTLDPKKLELAREPLKHTHFSDLGK